MNYMQVCSYVHRRLCTVCVYLVLCLCPSFHTTCFMYCMTLEGDGKLVGLLPGNSICHLRGHTKGACTTVDICYLTNTPLKPAHLHLEWTPCCQWSSIPLAQGPSHPLHILLCRTQRANNSCREGEGGGCIRYTNLVLWMAKSVPEW